MWENRRSREGLILIMQGPSNPKILLAGWLPIFLGVASRGTLQVAAKHYAAAKQVQGFNGRKSWHLIVDDFWAVRG
jgi:hypothetical protein